MMDITDLHPSKITRIENGAQVQMNVCEYLYIHAQTLTWKGFLRPINKLKYGTKSRDDRGESDRANQIEDLKQVVSNTQNQRNLYQRGLGLFNTLTVNEERVRCTCENYRKFGKCEESELFAFIFLGKKGYPTQDHAVNFNSSAEGYPKLSAQLKQKIMNLVEVSDDLSIGAPSQDPCS